jgi:hypothetical protein
MHRRFWTVCAAANILLFFFTSVVVYMRHQDASGLQISLTRRSTSQWLDGMAAWREFYLHVRNVSDASYLDFLPAGLAAVGCSDLDQGGPSCRCLFNSHLSGAHSCVAVAQKGMENCFMNMRPSTSVVELDRAVKPFALLNALNAWGMMGSVLVWIRMYTIDSEIMMPYLMQLVLGSFAMVIHCSILEPTTSAFVLYILLVAALCLLSFYHRGDKRWWVSTFLVQYLFSVPTLTLLNHSLTLKRDITFVAATMGIATTYGLVTLGKVLLEELFQEAKEPVGSEKENQSCAVVASQTVLMALFFGLTSLSYAEPAPNPFRCAYVVWYLFSLYLGLGMVGVANIKRICVTELLFRACISGSMLFELSMRR